MSATLTPSAPASPTRDSAVRDSTAGVGTLLKLGVRRDRVMLPAWLYALIAAIVGTAFSIKKLYPTQASRDQLAQSIGSNPSLRALYGPMYDTHSLGALTAWRILSVGGLMLGVFCALLITRHTRAEEEDGRLELLGAGAIGRSAPLTAALSEAFLVCFTVGLVAAVVMPLLLGQGVVGSLCFGLTFTAVGMVFAGASAIAAQLTETGRAANGIGGAVLGLAYLLRAVGDAAGSSGAFGWIAWLSPLGVVERVHPWAGNRWWIIALLFAAAAVEITGAYALAGRRDLGSGLLPQRPGPAAAAPSLVGAGGLARRLQRGSLLGWSAGMLAMGLVLGGITKGIQQLVEGSSQVQDVMARYGGTQGATDSYLSTATTFLGLGAAVYAVQSVLRLRSEETAGRAEPVLAGTVSRTAWATSHLVFPALGSVVLMLAGGLGAGVGAGAALGGVGGWTGRMIGSALVQVPAVWLFAGVGVALFGLVPKWTSAAWGFLGLLLFISYIGPAFNVGQWLLDLTPFTHVPRLPGRAFSWPPLVVLTLLSAVLTAGGLSGLRRRDITS